MTWAAEFLTSVNVAIPEMSVVKQGPRIGVPRPQTVLIRGLVKPKGGEGFAGTKPRASQKLTCRAGQLIFPAEDVIHGVPHHHHHRNL